MKKVLVFGSFDLIHPGHYYFFKEAKKQGTHLSVVLANDKTIEKVKGKKPLYNIHKRKKQLEEINIIDDVVIGSLDDKYDVIRKIKPDIICLGHDQFTFVENLKKFLKTEGLNTKVIRLEPYKREKYSSSIYKQKLIGKKMDDEDKEIGRVVEFYENKKVAVVEITDDIVNKDDILIFKNKEKSIKSKIHSMQIEKEIVNSAKPSDVVGIKLEQDVKKNDIVLKKK